MLVQSLNDLRDVQPSAVSVGNFDGVHKGHAALIGALIEQAQNRGLRSVVVTFEPHTRSAVNPTETIPLLSVFDEKAVLFERLGVNMLVRVNFDTAIRSMSPHTFAKTVLHRLIGAQLWVMGSDHRFGKDAAGDKNSLRDEFGKYDINTFAVDLFGLAGKTISSTAIRMCIGQGQVAKAMEMLGHPYLIRARRVQGEKVGTRIGYPTLNFSGVVLEKVVPPAGVYAARLEHDGVVLNGALYFGDCPTFGNRDVHFEFHVLGAFPAEPPLGTQVSLWLYKHIRPDHKFDSSQILAEQIHKDIVSINHFFQEI